MKKRRVVITGLGVVAPNGIGKDEFWQGCIQGRSGVDLIMSFDTSELNSKIAAQILDFDPLNYISRKVVKRTDRFVHLGLAASKMALEDSGLKLEKEDKDKVGVCIGSGVGGTAFHEAQMMVGMQRGLKKIHPLSVPKITPNAVSSNIALEFNIKGPNMCVSTACASSSHGIGQAFRMIQYNEADIVFTGGVEAPLTPYTCSFYDALNVLSRKNDLPQEASRPFDKERDGFVIGEGGAVLILEELSHAIKRNAHIYAEVIGYGSNSGAYHAVMPNPNGEDTKKVILAALSEADLSVKDIDFINAHGISTIAGDKVESLTIKRLFGEHSYNIPISSIKSMIGHTIGAAGALDTVASVLSIENNIIPPTINYQHPDPDCDLDYVPNKARTARVNTVLSNSFGFGNNNTAIIMRRFNHQ